MRLRYLELSDYRNFQRLELELPSGLALFVGQNAAGKSNLLEAVYLLATMRGLRAATDVQLIRHGALSDPLPAARVVGEGDTQNGPLKVEVTVVARPGAHGPIATKKARINGGPKRLSSAVGQFTAVLFSADDLEMIGGAPSLRRRYLDIMLAQVDTLYAAARQRLERVLLQRNHLLKRIREGQAHPEELVFWDSELSRDGGLIFQRRAQALTEMARLASECHASLAADEQLSVTYAPRIEAEAAGLERASETEAADAYADALRCSLNRDIAAGMTLTGPHRDDVMLGLNGLAAAAYASRAQQRTTALSLRLAEARFLTAHRGEPPLLLLDDVLSEMDGGRRQAVLNALTGAEQMLVTGTDWDRFPPDFASRGAQFSVESGAIGPRSDIANGARISAS